MTTRGTSPHVGQTSSPQIGNRTDPPLQAPVAALLELAAAAGNELDAAREANVELRKHEVFRRLRAEAGAEAIVRSGRASAALAGARLPVPLVRSAVQGLQPWPDDAAGLTVHGAIRAAGAVPELVTIASKAPLQALARLHLAAAAGLVPLDALGRPRGVEEEPGDGADLLLLTDSTTLRPVVAPSGTALMARLDGVTTLIAAPASVPASLIAALVLAEIWLSRPFLAANGVVARAMTRAVLMNRGGEPTGLGQWEEALLALGPKVPLALAQYSTGSHQAVLNWISLFAQAQQQGAERGVGLADSVLAGRLS